MENIKVIIREKLDSNSLREFYSANELVKFWSKNPIVWSWGAHAWVLYEREILRFTVNGHHHKGHVYLMVNGSDLFDVYLTSSQGNIKAVYNDIYIEDITSFLDEKIEKIPSYKF